MLCSSLFIASVVVFGAAVAVSTVTLVSRTAWAMWFVRFCRLALPSTLLVAEVFTATTVLLLLLLLLLCVLVLLNTFGKSDGRKAFR